jgi:transcriptional regulator with XRE-family HTH domain
MAEQAQRVGDRIAYERKARNWSRPQMARELTGLATGNDVYRWERGKHMPRLDTLEAVAELFKIEVADLYAGVPDDSSAPADADLSDELAKAEPGSKVEEMLQELLDQQAQLLADVSEVRSEQERLSPLLERLGRDRAAKRR